MKSREEVLRVREVLKPCPCCGGEADCNNRGICDKDGNPLWWVECLECGLSTNGHKTREEVIAVWNRRYEPPNELPNKPLALDELREMDGAPVYIVDGEEAEDLYWELSENAEDYVDCRDPEEYGKTWSAYRRKLEEKLK